MDYYQRTPSKGLGVASLVLGIVSLVFFCSCANIVTAIIAIIMGIVQIARFGKYGRAYALGGIITSVISIILLVVFWVVVSSNTALSDSVIDFSQGDSALPKSFEEYLEEYGNDSIIGDNELESLYNNIKLMIEEDFPELEESNEEASKNNYMKNNKILKNDSQNIHFLKKNRKI